MAILQIKSLQSLLISTILSGESRFLSFFSVTFLVVSSVGMSLVVASLMTPSSFDAPSSVFSGVDLSVLSEVASFLALSSVSSTDFAIISDVSFT